MCSYCKKHDETEVPDPYYGGQQGFEKVIQQDFKICLFWIRSVCSGMISKDNFTDSNTIFIPSKLILTYLNHVSRYFWT